MGGDNKQGSIQDPLESTLTWDNGGKVKPESKQYTYEDAYRVTGNLVFRHVPQDRELTFTFGQRGFSRVLLKSLDLSLKGLCQQHGRDAVVEALGGVAGGQILKWAEDNPRFSPAVRGESGETFAFVSRP